MRHVSRNLVLAIAAACALITPALAETVTQQQHSDSQLLNLGLDAYERGRLHGDRDALAEALGWMVAYVQRDTRAFREDRRFADDLLTAIHETRRYLAASGAGGSAGAKGDDLRVSGGGTVPPRRTVRRPRPPDRAVRDRRGNTVVRARRGDRPDLRVEARPRTRRMVCRGGGALRFEFRTGGYGMDGPGAVTRFRWTHDAKIRRHGVGRYHEYLRPGTCAWSRGSVGDDDPTGVCTTGISEKNVLVWTVRGAPELRLMPPHLEALQKAENFVVFDVYENRENCLVATNVTVLR